MGLSTTNMKKYMFLLAAAGLGLSALATPPAKKAGASVYKLDAAASSFKWHATKVTGEHSGVAKFVSGTVSSDGKSVMGGDAVVDMNSIDATDLTGEYHDKLVGHLKSEDFFSVAKFPTAAIKVKSMSPIAGSTNANNYNVVADLTIKGITNEITFPAIVVANAKQVVVNAEFKINRAKYDVRYGSKSFFEGLGDKAIHDDFDIKVRLVANK